MKLRLFSAIVLALAVGCGPSSHGTTHLPNEGRTAASVEVSEDQFASAVRDLLSSAPSTAERQTRLEGVLARQMDRAHALFRKKSSERGLTAVKGGLYLARAGDLQATTLGPHGAEALESAVKEVAQRGDEGRSRALYEVLLRIAPQQKKADVQGHLEALSSWTKDGQTASVESGAGAGMDAPSEAQRVALTRALLEPSAAALDDATKATIAWFTAALHPLPSWSRWDRVERARALQSASATILALHLRDADPRGAVQILEHNEHLRQTAPRRLFAAVAALADKPEGERWREVLDALLPSDDGEDDPVIDRDLLGAALVTTATEAYRFDPSSLKPALTLAELLQSFGMGEASPAVLVAACKAHPDALSLEQSLAITDRALDTATEMDDEGAARRTFKAAEPILAIAEHSKLQLKTTPAHIRGTMGEIELREGHLDVARDLLKNATSAEPSPSLLLDLARIERHDGDMTSAAAHLKTALDTAQEPAIRGEITLVSSEVLVAQGDTEGAKKQLEAALKALVTARSQVREPGIRARMERAMARIYDKFGLAKQADEALVRALEAAPRDKTSLAATLALAGSRAVVRGDLKASRDALHRAITADLDDDDLVYFALWERAVERTQKAISDGVAERVFESVHDDGSWSSKLAMFGMGKLGADALVAAAQSPSKKAEAQFYVGLDKRSKGDRAGGDEAFKQVAAGAGVDLIEADVAQKLLSPPTPLNPPPSVLASVP